MKRLAAATVLAALALTACSSGGDTAGNRSSSTAGTADSVKGAPPQRAVAPAAGGALKNEAPLDVGRSQILTASVQVEVQDVRRAADAAEQLVVTAGGEVAQEQVDLQAKDPRASLRLQVPPNRLSAVLDQLAGLGHELGRQRGSEDVTDQVVDIQSRLATQQASVIRVRKLLDRATSLSDIVRLESELAQREADLESLQARLRAVSNRVAMAEVTVELTTAGKAAPRDAQVGFSSGLRGGWHALLAGARVTGAALGALLPFLPLLLAAGWVAWWLHRRNALT